MECRNYQSNKFFIAAKASLYLGPDLVSALPGLDVHDLSHLVFVKVSSAYNSNQLENEI